MRKLLLAVAPGLLVAAFFVVLLTTNQYTDPPVSERTIGNMTTKVTPPDVRTGEKVRLSLTVTGPAEYDSCRPVGFWATNAAGRRVWTETQFWACARTGQESLPAGMTKTFFLDWQTTGLAPGVYAIHGWFGLNQPPLAENIPVVSVGITR